MKETEKDMNVAEQIKYMVELQRLDSDIFRFNRELENQPVLLAELDSELAQEKNEYEKKEAELKKVMIKRKEKENELISKENEIKKLQAQLYQLKSNKEYQAMEKEISLRKADVSVLEEEIIGLLDKLDEMNKRLSEQKGLFNKKKQECEEEKLKIKQRTEDLRKELERLNAERSQKIQDIDKDFLSKYERILRSKDGLAMVSVNGNACGGCNINLPPQVINEIKMKEDLVFCENCARILYIEEEAQDN